jgi:Uncharacterised nucleotidyltransferase
MSMLASLELPYNLLLKGELLQVAREFERRAIRYYVIKGIPFTLTVSGRIDTRAMVDNDLVVAESDVGLAYQTLLQMGFRDQEHAFAASRAANFQHALCREHRGQVTSQLELHWQPFSPILFRNGDALFEHLTDFELDETQLPTLNPTATIVHLATHWLQHSLNKSSILRDLGAAWTTLGAQVEPENLLALARLSGARTCLGAALSVATTNGYCEPTWPTELLTNRARALVAAFGAERLAQDTEPSYARALAAWGFLDNTAPLRAARWELFPPVARMRLIYGNDLAPLSLAARYVLRPVQALLKK